jgi:hypothetical protein
MKKQENNYSIFQLFLMQLSISIALIMLDAPLFIIIATPVIMFSPLFLGSLTYATILFCLYDIIRPILYISALVVTIGGKQDFFAIAFYVIFGLQAITIVKRLIGTICIIIVALTEGK